MNKFKLMAVLIMGLMIAAGTLLAQRTPPTAPVNLAATVEQGNATSFIQLTWSIDGTGTPPIMFVIYMADKQTDQLTDFKKFNYLKVGQNNTDFKFMIDNLKTETYSFYVTAAIYDQNTMLESQPSGIVTINYTRVEPPFIRIVSKPPTQVPVNQLVSYQVKVESNINCPIDIFEIAPPVPQGMQIDNTGLLTWTPATEGVFGVTIKAGTTCKINVAPAVQAFKIYVGTGNNQSYVRVMNPPPPITIKPNETWTYQLKAESNVKCPILFEIVSNGGPIPQGFILDKTTGMITYTAGQNQPTSFVIVVKAYLDCDNTIFQMVKIAINTGGGNQPKTCAVIKGTVTYEDGTNVPDGMVRAYSTNYPTPNSVGFVGPIKNGVYTINVPEGIFIVNADGPSFFPMFFDNAATIDKATKIDVKCETNVPKEYVANFVVKMKPQPKYYVVTGKVTSEADGSPVMTMVEFIPVQNLNGNDKNGQQNPPFQTKTDQSGNYSIKLPDANIYIAHVPPTQGFMEQFYDLVDSPYQADMIELTADVTGIDFVLKGMPNVNKNGFAGIVKSDSGLFLRSRIIASLVKPADPNITKRFTLSTESDDKGNFKFFNLIPGDYVLLSIPFDRRYVPGYYKSADVVTLKWKDATRISVDNVMLTVVTEITHRFRAGLKGIIKIDGNVNSANGVMKGGGTPQGTTTPVPEAFVYVIDQFGEISDFALTNALGAFELTEVDQGANRLVVDKPGYTGYEQVINLDYNKNTSANVSIGLEEETLGIEPETFTVNGFAAYPSPASNLVNIKFDAAAGSATLNVFNSMGSYVLSQNFETVEGTNLRTINLESLSNGVYFIKVTSGSRTAVLPLTIVR